MVKLNKKQKEELTNAIDALKALIGETQNQDTSCWAFRLGDEVTQKTKDSVRIYTSTWILSPLERLEKSVK